MIYTNKANKRLAIETVRYDVKILIEDVEEIEVRFETSIDDALDIYEKDGTLYIKSEYEKRKVFKSMHHYGSIECRIPNTVKEIECNGVDSKIDIQKKDEIESSMDVIKLKVVNGHITIQDIDTCGMIDIDTVAGEVHIKNTDMKDLGINSVSSYIELEESPFDRASVNTVEGRCAIYQNPSDSRINVFKKTLFGSYTNTSDCIGGSSHLNFHGVSGELQIRNR